MSSVEHIVGSERLVAALGYWPSFHDAEVVSVSAQRMLPVVVGGGSVELVVNVRKYEARGEGTTQYQQVISRSVLVRFLCTEVVDLEPSEFNHQNVINSLSVQSDPTAGAGGSSLVLTIEPIWGIGGKVRCARVELCTVQVLSNAGA